MDVCVWLTGPCWCWLTATSSGITPALWDISVIMQILTDGEGGLCYRVSHNHDPFWWATVMCQSHTRLYQVSSSETHTYSVTNYKAKLQRHWNVALQETFTRQSVQGYNLLSYNPYFFITVVLLWGLVLRKAFSSSKWQISKRKWDGAVFFFGLCFEKLTAGQGGCVRFSSPNAAYYHLRSEQAVDFQCQISLALLCRVKYLHLISILETKR